MAYTLKNNAYHILGLDTSASDKDVLKRSREIINRLKIDDYPEYELDIGLFKNYRTEDSVKEALQKMQAPKKHIKEYFFWFQIVDSIDEQVVGLLKSKDYLNAIRTWEIASNGSGTKAYFYKKNLAILYCLVLSVEQDKQYLQDSLAAWKELIDSNKFWNSFSKVYKLHNEQTANDDIIADFRNHVVEYLSDIYTDLHEAHKNSEYLSEFQAVFSGKGEKVEKTILAPAYQAINKAVEGLEKLEISKDGKFDQEESDSIKKFVAIVQQELNKLIDLGLYDDSQTKIIRDRAASAIRSIVLDLHNQLSELNKSGKLLEVAIQIAGTESLKNKLATELEQINKNMSEEAENTVAINIPGGSLVVFKNSYVEYGNKKIFYKDAEYMSFHAVNHSVNFIPVSQSFSFMIDSNHERISFSISTTLHIGKKEMQEAWGRVAGISMHLLAPIIVKKLADRIFDKGEIINIGNIEFSKEGYSRSKLFGGKETVPWNGEIYIPKMESGVVILWRNKGSQFANVEISIPNAVVIPDLVQECYNRAQT